MSKTQQEFSGILFPALPVLGVLILLATAITLTNCGNTSVQFQSNPPVGSVRVSISDPPSCRVPAGDFKHIYVTVRSVQAHLNPTATDASPGWQELAPQLANAPVQVDLLSVPQNTCVLTQLGSNSSLPAGDYQQIRLVLVPNNPAASQPVPAQNACGGVTFNCAVLKDDSVKDLQLSSQANTGLKIPPGQILGGPIHVGEGQNVDINIDFNICSSLVLQGNGQLRLKPTLTAGQVSTNTTGISGRILDAAAMQPIAGGKVLVALEQLDNTGVDRVVMQTAADSSGNFNFCPLPSGMYDVIAVAIDGGGTAYNATALLNVPSGTAVGAIPLIAETGSAPPAGPGTIEGTVTAASGAAGASVDVVLHPLQAIQLPDATTRKLTIPAEGDSVSNVTTVSGGTCPAGTDCAQYTLIVPASNPQFGVFSASGTAFSTPATGDVLYSLEAFAFAPMSGGTPICSPARLATDKDSADQPLKVTGGTTTTAKQLDFTGCTL